MGGGKAVLSDRGEERLADMIGTSDLKDRLCQHFCTGFSVNPVPIGMAISTVFSDDSGDKVDFYLRADENGYCLEDDGQFISNLIGFGISVDEGTRGKLLRSILESGDAHLDEDTYEIKSRYFSESEIHRYVVKFISALIRVHDLSLLTRDVVASTFKEDALNAISNSFEPLAEIQEGAVIDKQLSEFPTDVVIRPTKKKNGRTGAVYFANTNEKLSEALLLKMEAMTLKRTDFEVIALIEEPDMRYISRKKFQRAQNRSLTMPIFRGDEDAAMAMIGRTLQLPLGVS